MLSHARLAPEDRGISGSLSVNSSRGSWGHQRQLECHSGCSPRARAYERFTRVYRGFARRFSDFLDEIWGEYDRQDALGEGVTTGWSGLDNFYRVRPSLSLSEQGAHPGSAMHADQSPSAMHADESPLQCTGTQDNFYRVRHFVSP
jgi:hypothetical protein